MGKKSRQHKVEISLEEIKNYDEEFHKDPTNPILRNSLSINNLAQVTQNREYMQSRNDHFSNEITPCLISTNQSLSGRCWLFATLNMIRQEMICKYDLPNDFEFSQSYLSFWDKLEKSNYFLNSIIENRDLPLNDNKNKDLLQDPIGDGGYWETSVNLIEKYGLIPQTVYQESYNSSCTDAMNKILEHKLREYAKILREEVSLDRCYILKKKFLSTVYDILCKLFGNPPHPNSEFQWEYCTDDDKDLHGQLERELKRRKLGIYENLENKHAVTTTPIEFYKQYVPFNCGDYVSLINDPRNDYYKSYTSDNKDFVYDAKRIPHINLPMSKIRKIIVKSILDNKPVQFSCDVGKYINWEENLMDIKCFNYKSVFKTSFDNMSKSDRIKYLESGATHAVVIRGVDIGEDGNVNKWQVENSWGDDIISKIYGGNNYYIMTNEWFENYGYHVVIHKGFVDNKTLNILDKEPEILPYDDFLMR